MRKTILILGLVFCYLTSYTQTAGTFKDPRDGKVYKTVKIGTQWIMAKNFAYKPSTGNCWIYKNDSSNIAKYGYLYDWETALTVAPKGWHLPTKDEWDKLYKYLGATDIKVYNAIKKGGNSGFNVLLGGARDDSGTFCENGRFATFWSATVSGKSAWLFFCDAANSIANLSKIDPTSSVTAFSDNSDLNDALNANRKCGFSVRLFRD